MNVNTGNIIDEAEFMALPKSQQHDYVQVPSKDLLAVQRMNRHERRAWAAKQRKASK